MFCIISIFDKLINISKIINKKVLFDTFYKEFTISKLFFNVSKKENAL